MSECADESISIVESKWDNGETCEQNLACLVVEVSRSVSERFSGVFLDAADE